MLPSGFKKCCGMHSFKFVLYCTVKTKIKFRKSLERYIWSRWSLAFFMLCRPLLNTAGKLWGSKVSLENRVRVRVGVYMARSRKGTWNSSKSFKSSSLKHMTSYLFEIVKSLNTLMRVLEDWLKPKAKPFENI